MHVRQARSSYPHCPAVTVTLDAGGAGTYTQRAIPGSEPSQFFSPLAVIYGQVVIVLAGLVTDVDPASRLARVADQRAVCVAMASCCEHLTALAPLAGLYNG